jgi:uncharacterized protein YPO0396
MQIKEQLEGYSLVRAEVYNWGNFSGWHRLNLMQLSLINKSPFHRNSMMAGENGSGKSTWMDGIMCMLFPFSTSLKMGVVDNTEDNSSGGRKIGDYVLGKYGANTSGEDSTLDLTKVYGRKTGISAFLIHFQHNSDPSKKVTVGRVWWFSDYKLKPNDHFFMAPGDVSIADPNKDNILIENSLPKNPKELKAVLDNKVVGSKTFDQAKDYFSEFSQTFGGVSKEDLKLLMKAATVKKISEIDPFIRENMLLHTTNESIVRLIAGVADADSISKDIDLYLEKIESMGKVIKELSKDFEVVQEKKTKLVEQKIIQGYGYWKDQEQALQQIVEFKKQIEKSLEGFPVFKNKLSEKDNELSKIQIELGQKDVASRVRNLEAQKVIHQSEVQIIDKEWKKVENWLAQAGFNKISRDVANLQILLDGSKDLIASNDQEKVKLEQELDCVKDLHKEQQGQITKIQTELDHLGKHQTRIPPDLYSIKNRIIEELGLPAGSLMFVGELIEIKSEELKYSKAVETTLNPISRNLLCHPDYTNQVSQWLNENKIYQTVVMKRITETELSAPSARSFSSNSTLSKIALKPKEFNPFYTYLMNWLSNGFDYKIVTTQEFGRADLEKGVTIEGLVKTDRRTQRKNSERTGSYLGWNHEDHEATLVEQLAQLKVDVQKNQEKIKSVSADLAGLGKKDQMVESLGHLDLVQLDYSGVQAKIDGIDKEIANVSKEDTDYEELRAKETLIRQDIFDLQQELADLTSNNRHAEEQIKELESEIAEKKELVSRLFSQEVNGQELRTLVVSPEVAFTELDKKIAESGMDILAYSQAIETEVTRLNKKLDESRTKLLLRDYEKEYNDTSLVYRVNSELEIESVKIIWEARKAEFESVGLKEAKAKWDEFYNSTLVEYIKSTSMEIRSEQHKIKENIESINEVLKKMDFEKIAAANETRFVQIRYSRSQDDRIVIFNKDLSQIEKEIQRGEESKEVEVNRPSLMAKLNSFVEKLKEENYSDFVTDVRNHYNFIVNSYSRFVDENGEFKLVEVFQGAKKDGKSGGQTVQLTYTLLAAALAYRMNFFHPVKGKDTLRLIILDEFGNNFDNEKPKASIELFNQMGFQCLFILPMTKTDLLSEYVNTFTAVYKKSASESKVLSYKIESKQDYLDLIKSEETV